MAIPQTIKDLANKVRTAVVGKDVRESIAKSMEETGNTADIAKQTADQQLERVDRLIIENPQPSEVVDARGSHPLLGDRLASTESLLAQTTEQIKTDVQYKSKKRKPLVTFIDDDGTSPVYTKLKPIFEARGVPCTIAIPSNQIGTSGRMPVSQLLELQNNLGWEIASHTKNHLNLAEITPEQIEEETGGSKAQLESLGLRCKNIVYPWGQMGGVEGRKIVRKHFRSGVATNGMAFYLNKPPVSQYALRRVGIGTMFDGTNAQFPATDTLEYYKMVVDEAIANNCWLIFMAHVAATSDTQLQYIADTIDYIQSKGVDIVNLDEGLDHFGNIIDIGDYEDRNNSNYFVADSEGRIHGTGLGTVEMLPQNSITSDKKATDFVSNKVYHSHTLGGTPSVGNPENGRAGAYELINTPVAGFQRQRFYPLDTITSYMRTWHSSGGWTEWLQEIKGYGFITVDVNVGVINPNSTKTIGVEYPEAKANTDFPMAAPLVNPNGAIIMSPPYCIQDGFVTLRFGNITTASVDVGTIKVKVKVIKG